MSLLVDFGSLRQRLRADRVHRELLVRAAKVKGVAHPLVLDATCGLAEDAMVLAAAGARVQGYEGNPVIHALAADALARAVQDPFLGPIATRVELHCGDSLQALRTLETTAESVPHDMAVDVVYLDPMFPARTKSAAVKKKFQLLHGLEPPCTDEEALLWGALRARPRKVVVKRPLKAPPLAGVRPAYDLRGKTVRFDVLLPCSGPVAAGL